MTPCPPARLAAVTAIIDHLTRIEYAADPDDALTMCGEFPGLVRALVDVLGDEGAKAYTVGVDHGLGTDRAVATAWDMSANPPELVPTNCDSCMFDMPSPRGRGCDAEWNDHLDHWIAGNIRPGTGSPKPGATGCPGWKAREPAPETAEDVARRCGLVRDPDAVDCWSVESTGASRVWRADGEGRWEVFEYPLTYDTELEALRAYAASVGK